MTNFTSGSMTLSSSISLSRKTILKARIEGEKNKSGRGHECNEVGAMNSVVPKGKVAIINSKQEGTKYSVWVTKRACTFSASLKFRGLYPVKKDYSLKLLSGVPKTY